MCTASPSLTTPTPPLWTTGATLCHDCHTLQAAMSHPLVMQDGPLQPEMVCLCANGLAVRACPQVWSCRGHALPIATKQQGLLLYDRLHSCKLVCRDHAWLLVVCTSSLSQDWRRGAPACVTCACHWIQPIVSASAYACVCVFICMQAAIHVGTNLLGVAVLA